MAMAKRKHPFPSRTRKLSSSAPMVLRGGLRGRVGRRRDLFKPLVTIVTRGFLFSLPYPTFKSPHSYWIIDSNDTAAVSARNILFPKETM